MEPLGTFLHMRLRDDTCILSALRAEQRAVERSCSWALVLELTLEISFFYTHHIKTVMLSESLIQLIWLVCQVLGKRRKKKPTVTEN